MEDSVISFNNVIKKYRVYSDKSSTIKELLTRKNHKYTYNTILDQVSFKINKGESVGIIGKNGIGKSTILKLISKIIYPEGGEIKVNGRVCSLLELGAGFSMEFTGLQNIYFNASIYGISKKEVDSLLDEIIEFAGIGEYINEPVRTYSTGMFMRLAFSVAIHIKADIIIIDEVFAVGDEEFQIKCVNKLKELNKRGVTIIIVSHDMDSLLDLCTRVLFIKDKKIYLDSDAKTVIDAYLKEERKI